MIDLPKLPLTNQSHQQLENQFFFNKFSSTNKNMGPGLGIVN